MAYALLFPGQGSQYVGMGRAAYAASPAARAIYEEADALLGYAVSTLCFSGPAEDLNRTRFTQPALFTSSVAMWVAYRDRFAEPPACVAGHSLGEYAALVAAEVLPFAQALQIVAERGRLMDEAGEETPGLMAALIGATLEQAEQLCAAVREATGEVLVVANDNCPGQVVISGTQAAVQMASARAGEFGLRRVMPLKVSIAGHSPLMESARQKLAAFLEGVTFQTPRLPVVFNATAAPVSDPDKIRELVLYQLTRPVWWRDSLLWMAGQGLTRFVECGPKDVLTGLVKRTLPEAEAFTLDAAA